MNMVTHKFFSGVNKISIFGITFLLSICISHSAHAGTPWQKPLFLEAGVKPIMMLNMSKDHQLFFKLYDDYSDITSPTGGAPDGIPDVTYVHAYDYYGYFDSDKCYTYNTTNKLFIPHSYTANKYCNEGSVKTYWSGNFLNWVSMTRIDAVRKILYGGYRSVDTSSNTVLERALLPNDAHSYAKYYTGDDVSKLTPYGNNGSAPNVKDRGITICNTTSVSAADRLDKASHSVDTADAPPVMRVVQGNYSLWASHGGFECLWAVEYNSNGTVSYNEGDTGSMIKLNGNNLALSGIDAYDTQPARSSSAVLKPASDQYEYNVRVSVCSDSALISALNENNEKCLAYGSNYKPVGLLQGYANLINFGLITGSYGKNKSGGVLRKPVGNLNDELNTDGTFKNPTYGIIKTLDLLRIYGYRFKDGYYFQGSTSNYDNCAWGKYSFNNGQCSNWGNPQAEIYLESLRYLSGKTTPKFGVDDSTKIAGLNAVTSSWTDPITPAPAGNYCAPLNILQFNSSTTSYDNDELTASTYNDVTANAFDATKVIGNSEAIHNNSFFVGEAGTLNNQLCTGKVITDLSTALGICPESPRLSGGYNIAGLAYLARKDGLGAGREKVKTFGVALAPAVPKITVKVPGSTTKTVTIMPACRADEGAADKRGNCAIVDFKVVNPTVTSTAATGKLYVNWEDSEQGGDYDQDMWGVIDYQVTATNVTIKTKVAAQSAWLPMGFGYVIGGTTTDGFHVHSGTNRYIDNVLCTTAAPCNCLTDDDSSNNTDAWQGNCNSNQNQWREKTFNVNTTSPKSLESPLYYAAKWGGYGNNSLTPTEIAASAPETYFYATDPRKLEESLEKAFSKAAGTIGSAATVAANSAQLNTDSRVFQARFNSSDWTGEVKSYKLNADGTFNTTDGIWHTDSTLTKANASSRKIYTYDGATTKSLVNLTNWASLTAAPNLKAALKLSAETTETNAERRYKWLRGTVTDEEISAAGLRDKNRILGDIINSDPAFAGGISQRFNTLPAEYGSASYLDYVAEKKARTSAVFVGANDGMLHAFNANTGAELFAYIPRGAYSKLSKVSASNYSHEFLVDGPVYVGDVYFNSSNDGVSGQWRTIVVGTLGAGGRAVYALDVTNVLKTGGDPVVIFDLDASDTTFAHSASLGYAISKPLIVPVPNGRWVALFGNGNNSAAGTARLMAINIEDPTDAVAIDTKAAIGLTKDNGLSGVSLLPNGDGVTTVAYAGDIAGNMWKFDLSGNNLSNWGVAYGNSSNPKPLITVIDSAGNPQPILSTPTLGRNALKKVGNTSVDSVMVYFGTGKYYEDTDRTSTSVQSIYAIADSGSAIELTTANRETRLHKKEITAQTTTRTISNDDTPASGTPQVSWATKDGWFLDLFYVTAKGERVLSKPLLMFDRLILTTFTPSSNQCDFGGSSWVMELTGVGDKYIGHSVLATNENKLLPDPVLSGLIPIIAGEKVILLGSELGKKDKPSELFKIDGNAGAGSRGRMSWRQVK